MKIWEPKPPGTLWDTPGLLRDSPLICYTMTLQLSKETKNVATQMGFESLQRAFPHRNFRKGIYVKTSSVLCEN